MQKIVKAVNIGEIATLLNECTHKDLVVWDVDQVLIVPKESMFRPINTSKAYVMLDKHFGKRTSSKFDNYFSTFIKQIPMELVDSKFPLLFNNLRERKVKCVGLTAMIPGAGECGMIKRMQDFRFNKLLELNLDFSIGCEIKEQYYDELKGVKRVPTFSKGILYSQPSSKGKVLNAYLTRNDVNNVKPVVIYFIDDSAGNLLSVYRMCEKNNIKYVGILYEDQKFENETTYTTIQIKKRILQFIKSGKW